MNDEMRFLETIAPYREQLNALSVESRNVLLCAEDRLKELGLGLKAVVQLELDGGELTYEKIEGNWRLWHVKSYEDIVPAADSKCLARTECAAMIPVLLDDLKKNTEITIERARKDIASVQNVLEEVVNVAQEYKQYQSSNKKDEV